MGRKKIGKVFTVRLPDELLARMKALTSAPDATVADFYAALRNIG